MRSPPTGLRSEQPKWKIHRKQSALHCWSSITESELEFQHSNYERLPHKNGGNPLTVCWASGYIENCTDLLCGVFIGMGGSSSSPGIARDMKLTVSYFYTDNHAHFLPRGDKRRSLLHAQRESPWTFNPNLNTNHNALPSPAYTPWCSVKAQ